MYVVERSVACVRIIVFFPSMYRFTEPAEIRVLPPKGGVHGERERSRRFVLPQSIVFVLRML
jgi:hypothetical protein